MMAYFWRSGFLHSSAAQFIICVFLLHVTGRLKTTWQFPFFTDQTTLPLSFFGQEPTTRLQNNEAFELKSPAYSMRRANDFFKEHIVDVRSNASGGSLVLEEEKKDSLTFRF